MVGFLVSSSATSTIRNRTASLNAGRFPGWKVMAWSTIPMPIAAIAIVGNRSIRPIPAAASAWRRKLGPRTSPSGSPTVPARRNIATYARTLAITQTIVCRRFTGMPSVAARSPRSADARIAVPNAERCMNRPSATKQTGTRMIVRTSVALNVTPGSVKLTVNGGVRRGEPKMSRLGNHWGMNSAKPVSTCEIPIVATVTIRRGEL